MITVDPQKIIIDVSTGDIENVISADDTYTITRKSETDYLTQVNTTFNKENRFIKLWTENIPFLTEYLSEAERGFLFSLFPYVSYRDNILKTSGNYLGKPLNQTDVCQLLKMEYKPFYKRFKSLLDKEIIAKIKSSEFIDLSHNKKRYVYVLNPYIACCGTGIEKATINYFKNLGWTKNLWKKIKP